MISSQASIFESFNARWLEPQQVALTFVPPGHYINLIKRRNTLIVGPRGSGKTTLLKMLQGPALEAWKHRDAQEYRSRIDFTGVFIPADRSWSAQINAVGKGQMEPEYAQRLGIAAFTTHVLRSLVTAIEYRIGPPDDPLLFAHRRAELSRKDEARFVQDLADAWFLRPTVPSLLALRHALSARLSNILELSSSESTRGSSRRGERLAAIQFLHLNFTAAAGDAVDVFNSLIRDEGGKWALLFDELELAPNWIREELMGCLRSTDTRFLFKLSRSPYTADKRLTPTDALEGSDYDVIPLWYAQKEQGYEFCRSLVQSMLADKGLSAVTPEDFLGPSEFDVPDRRETGPQYRPGSRIQRRFANLERKDSTFQKYLRERNLDVRRFHMLRDSERAAEVRKVAALVAVRDAFRRGDKEDVAPKARSRKNPNLYRGASALFAIVEGNPRWLIGIVNPVLERFAKEYAAERRTLVRPWVQATEVARAGNRFRAFLKTIPCPPFKDGEPVRGVLGILDAIGRYFFDRLVFDEFNPDPPGSFVVDDGISDGLMTSLALALNAGAIVYVPDPRSEFVLASLRGRRFRLSYLLATHYRLAIQLGRAVSLSTILNETDGIVQTPLFRRDRNNA